MNEKAKLLIVDDDATLIRALDLYLSKAGYEVISAPGGVEGMREFHQQRPDLVILDIMMPQLDGWEVCRRIRDVSDVPLIMLTAKGQEVDRVRGLKMGADDYIAKPFSMKELEARVEATLRRTRLPAAEEGGIIYADDRLVVDSRRRLVTVDDERVELTATEYEVLFHLAGNAGRTLATERILERVWGPAYVNDVDYVKLYVWRLRQKIEPIPSEPEYIITERGIGYRFTQP